MQNTAIAQVFREIARLLKQRQDNIFKIRAYEKAARAIAEMPEPVTQLLAEGRLREIPGAGEAITAKITERVTTGKLGYYEKLQRELPVNQDLPESQDTKK